MKRSLLSFITVFVLIPCLAQQTYGQANLRPLTPCPPFGILNPVSQTICTGSRVGFVASSGLGSYGAWEMSSDGGITWQPSPGNTVHFNFGDSLIIPVVSESLNGHLFRCVYDSICEDIVFTDYAILTVANLPLAVTAQPADVSVCKNYPVDYTVKANGSSIKYQWQVSTNSGIIFTNLTGKTSPLLHFDSAFLYMNNNRYRCIITSDCSATVISDIALLTVKDEVAATIVTQPVNQFACPGDSTTFSINVTGNNVGYQWQQGWYPLFSYQNIAGANASTFTAAVAEWNKYYRCVVTGNCKTLYSYQVRSIAIDSPVMSNAETRYFCNGEQVYLGFGDVTYQQENLFNYQWQVSSDNGITFNDIAGGNYYSLPLIANTSNNNNIYRCHVSNSCFDGYSNFLSVKANIPVAITQQPQDQNACNRWPVTFSVKTTGSVSQYQWQQSWDGGITFTNIPIGMPGVNDTDLTITIPIPAYNNYQYRCKISSNCFDTVYSNAAVLHVYPNPTAPNDTLTEVVCDTCKTNISGLFNTAGYATTSWINVNPFNAGAGRYTYKFFNTANCFDSAFAYVNIHNNDTLNICRNGISKFHSNISGNSYQWQINTGSGFTDIHDSIGIAGANSGDLTLYYSLPMQVRCKVDNSYYSDTTYVRVTAYWTGITDSDWINPLNWNCGEFPYHGDEYIYIPAGVPHMPEISRVTVYCKKLFLAPDAELTIKHGFNLLIFGGD